MTITRELMSILLAGCLLAGCATINSAIDPAAQETLYQVSTFRALQEGVYDGEVTTGELTRHGDLGIGTFNALDGELMLLGTEVFCFRADGTVTQMPDRTPTPFASVTFFDADIQQPLSRLTDYPIFQTQVDATLPTLNLPYAVRIDGTFSYLKTRAPRRQTAPYPRLVDALAHQPEFEYRNVKGTILGFRLPPFMSAVNVPGWHLHFISSNRAAGGHVLAFTVDEARLMLDATPNVMLVLPQRGAFSQADLSRDTSREVTAIEGARAGRN